MKNDKLQGLITCPPGLESFLKKELKMNKITAKDQTIGGVFFEGNREDVYKINLQSRIGNKVFYEISRGVVKNFEDLFQLTSKVDRKKILGKSSFIVNATSHGSQLTHTPSIQKTVSKSIYNQIVNESENPLEVEIRIINDFCYVLLNTSGKSLHQRGYRELAGIAPLKENVAAGMILLSGRKFTQPLRDPFCGSGTICIEAELLGKNIAPGINRYFAFEDFHRFDSKLFEKMRSDLDAKTFAKSYEIGGSDSDGKMLNIARENEFAAIGKNEITRNKVIFDPTYFKSFKGTVVCNPPFGERINPDNLIDLYKGLVSVFEENPNINGGFLTTYEVEPMLNEKLRKAHSIRNGGERMVFYKIRRF